MDLEKERFHPLDALSPLDGRYRNKTAILAAHFSERALMEGRARMEVAYFRLLAGFPGSPLNTLTQQEKKALGTAAKMPLPHARVVKEIETQGYNGHNRTNHDVKAIELSIADILKSRKLDHLIPWVHIALTSEDVNNIAYALMLREGLGKVIVPAIEKIIKRLEYLSETYLNLAMLARTHGQPASPTTLGKEFRVFLERLKRQVAKLKTFTLLVKLNGATGNYNAAIAAMPHIDWPTFTGDYVRKLNSGARFMRFEPNYVTTQIEPHDSWAELFHLFMRINTILLNFCQDTWRYISDDWFVQTAAAGETGSSTMPHKVNPIDFENAEGNLGIANALLGFFAEKLPISRLQRDLSDSTVERSIGSAFGHCLLAYLVIEAGLGKIRANETAIWRALDEHPEVITEAYQVILRREGVQDAYFQLNQLSRGQKLTMDMLHAFVDGLPVSDNVKEKMRLITPHNYIGLANLTIP